MSEPFLRIKTVKERFFIDPETGLPHIFRHAVAESEVQEILDRPLEDRGGREETRVAIGRTEAGRFLRVIYVPEPHSESYSSLLPMS